MGGNGGSPVHHIIILPILNQRVLKMTLFGTFCGRSKIYTCWLAPTCPYSEEADTPQSAYVSGEPRAGSFRVTVPSAGHHCPSPVFEPCPSLASRAGTAVRKELLAAGADSPVAGFSLRSLTDGVSSVALPGLRSESAACESNRAYLISEGGGFPASRSL